MDDLADRLLDPDVSDLPAGVRGALPPAETSYALARPTAAGWARAVTRLGCRRLLEYGAGASSRVAAEALRAVGGGRLTTVEQDPTWCVELWAQTRSVATVDAAMVVAGRPTARWTRHGLMHGYFDTAGELAERGPYDAVLIDAPQGCYGRDAGLWLALPHLSAGAIVMLDDAGRWKERLTLKRWRRAIPSAELVAYDATIGASGAAVLRVHKPTEARAIDWSSASATVLCGVNAWSRWRRPSQAAA
jgi:hypothetical protein